MATSKFALFAAETSKRMFLGTLLKYVKGEWQAGPNRDLIPADMAFVPIMDTLTVGFIKWRDGATVDDRLGLVADGFYPPHRNTLDDLDSTNWEIDDNGVRIDPWQRTTLLVFADANEPRNLYTFSTTSEGGRGAIGALCAAHSQATEGVGQYPVVTLATDSYLHKDKRVGRVKFPVFKPIGAVEAAPFNAIVAGARGGAGFIPTSSPALQIESGDRPWDDDGAPPITEVPDGPDDDGPGFEGEDCPV
jgi:hypothetical protein